MILGRGITNHTRGVSNSTQYVPRLSVTVATAACCILMFCRTSYKVLLQTYTYDKGSSSSVGSNEGLETFKSKALVTKCRELSRTLTLCSPN